VSTSLPDDNGTEFLAMTDSTDEVKKPTKNLKAAQIYTKYTHHRTAMGESIPPLSHLGIIIFYKGIPTPSALDYAPKMGPSGFEYSILGKHDLIKKETTPAPNSYNAADSTLVFDNPPYWSFGRKLKEPGNLMADAPAPNAYVIDEAFGKNKVSCTMSGRHGTKTYITPGPRYLPAVDHGPSPKYSFGSKQETKTEITPG
jgi:hypothetical protein